MRITSGHRKIKKGYEYNHFFPPADNADKIILKNGDVHDTVSLMGEIVRKTLAQTEVFAAHLKDNTNPSKMEICRKLWVFCYNHIQYKLDQRGLEQLRQPARSWADRNTGIDCDCMSIFVSSILCNMGIEHKYRITKYGGKPNFQHVYIVVPDGSSEIIIDCVLSKFNYEKPYSEKKDFIMKPTINGLGGIDIAMLSGTSRSLGEVIDDVNNKVHFSRIENPDNATLAYLRDLQIIFTFKPNLSSDPKNALKFLDYIIKHWNTPHRDEALRRVCENEETLEGLGDLGKLLKKIAAKRAVKKEQKTIRKVAKQEAKVAKKQAKVAKKVAKKEAKTARKVAKQEAKTARKVARQETKQARIAAKTERRAIRQENRTARVALRKGNQPLPEEPELEDDEMFDDDDLPMDETQDLPEDDFDMADEQDDDDNYTSRRSRNHRRKRRRGRKHHNQNFEDFEDDDDDFDDDWDEDEDDEDWDEQDDDFDEDDDDYDDEYDDEYDIDGMVEGDLGFFRRNPQKKALKAERKQAKKQAKAEKKVAKKEEKARIKALPRGQRLKARVKKVGKAIVKFNPLTIASRGGVLVAMRMNIGKMASKLKWGYATQADVDAGKLTKAQWEASKKALAKTESIFTKIGGDKAKLKIAILYGKGGKGTLKGGELGIVGTGLGTIRTELGEVATGAAIAAAIPVIVSIVKALQGAGIMKGDEVNAALSLLDKPDTIKELENELENEAQSGGGESSEGGDFIKKNKTMLIVGGVAVAGVLAYTMLRGKKSKTANNGGLSGVNKTQRKPKKIILT